MRAAICQARLHFCAKTSRKSDLFQKRCEGINKVIHLGIGVVALNRNADNMMIRPFETGNFNAVLHQKLALQIGGIAGRHWHGYHLRRTEFRCAKGVEARQNRDPAGGVLRQIAALRSDACPAMLGTKGNCAGNRQSSSGVTCTLRLQPVDKGGIAERAGLSCIRCPTVADHQGVDQGLQFGADMKEGRSFRCHQPLMAVARIEICSQHIKV
jgi:hypothetical protein